MFKTIFSKLTVIFIAILIFSFSVTGIMLYYFLGDFVSNEKVKVLEKSGEKINSFLNKYGDQLNTEVGQTLFMSLLDSYRTNTNSLIWIVNTDGRIVISEEDTVGIPSAVKSKLKNDLGKLSLPDPRQYKDVMQGKDPVEEIGNFYGLFKDSWLTIQKPIKNKDNKIIGAVYLQTPIPQIHTARSAVFKFYIISVSVSILISIVLVYIFSLSISRPLKQIRSAAKVIAGGEFQKRLNIKSRDEIGELARSFNQMAMELQNLEDMRRGFIANVSHELRTPMTSIRGFIEGILDGTIPAEKQEDYLTIVRDETNRLNRMVNDLLDLARMESGETTLNYINFDINELMRRCIIKLENLIVQKNILIEANFEQEQMYVHADIDAIERVIINLMHNAIKFTNEGGKITLSSISEKGKINILIEDNGVGIGKDEIERIWERFYKSDKSRGKDRSGTGLGLAIIKNIIQEHGQKIWVNSELGNGTKFSFSLDKAEEEET